MLLRLWLLLLRLLLLRLLLSRLWRRIRKLAWRHGMRVVNVHVLEREIGKRKVWAIVGESTGRKRKGGRER